MTNKTKILLAIFLTVLFVYPSVSYAYTDNYFRPNIKIPGMENFFSDVNQIETPVHTSTTSSTLVEMVTEYEVDGSGIIRYVSAIYSYAAVLAGVIAMFMLVFAAYQWMLAAGNAEKIGRAKDTISGTLLGLTLLFGGYLLLSQISTRLVVLVPISVPKISKEYIGCSAISNATECNAESGCIWNDEGKCVDKDVDYCASTFFSPWAGHSTIKDCSDYTDLQSCESNRCFGLDYPYSTEPLGEICINKGSSCENLRHQTCDSSADCQISDNPDSREWCCENILLNADRCRPVGGQDGIDASKCKD